MAQAIITLLLSLAFGLLGFGGVGLITAYVTGFIAAGCVLFTGKNAPPISAMLPRWALIRVAKLYAWKLASNTMLSLVNMLMGMSIAALLVIFYSQEIVGWYGLVFRVATAPVGLLTVALAQSFWSDAAILAKTDPIALRHFYFSSVKRLSIIAIPFGILFLFAPYYIPPIFGRDEWSGAGYLLAAVTPYLVGLIIFSPTTHLIVYGKSHWQLVCDFATVVVAGIGFVVVAKAGYPAWLAVTITSTLLFLGYIARFAIHLIANEQHRLNLLEHAVPAAQNG